MTTDAKRVKTDDQSATRDALDAAGTAALSALCRLHALHHHPDPEVAHAALVAWRLIGDAQSLLIEQQRRFDPALDRACREAEACTRHRVETSRAEADVRRAADSTDPDRP